MVTSLVQLLCRTTKLCWFEDDQFSRTVEDAKRLLEKGSQGGSTVRPCAVNCLSAWTWNTSSQAFIYLSTYDAHWINIGAPV